MDFLKQLSCVSLFALGVSTFAQDIVYDSLSTPPPTSSMDSLVSKIIEYHEDHFGVNYQGRVPAVLFDIPASSTIPAFYSVEDEVLRLSATYAGTDISSLLDSVSRPDISLNLFLLRKSLSHELGHFLTDIYISEYVPSSWLAPTFHTKSQRTLDDLDIELVVEGIAEYFEHAFNQRKNSFSNTAWHDSYVIEQFQNVDFLNVLRNAGARNIVEPLFNASPHEGLLWLLENELTLTPPYLSPVADYKNSISENLSFLEKQ